MKLMTVAMALPLLPLATVQGVLQNVEAVFAHEGAFRQGFTEVGGGVAALLKGGRLFFWGHSSDPFTTPESFDFGTHDGIQAVLEAGTVLMNDGVLYVHGRALIPNVKQALGRTLLFKNETANLPSRVVEGVKQLYGNKCAGAALRADGSMVSWGTCSGNTTQVDAASDVETIISNSEGFAAIRKDRSAFSWGSVPMQNYPEPKLSSGVVNIIASNLAFAALKIDGTVVTWGFGGGSDSSGVDFASGVEKIFSSGTGFAAITKDRSIVTWGESVTDGIVFQPPTGVTTTKIYSTHAAFAALQSDGSVVSWGKEEYGGKSTGVDFTSGGGVQEIFAAASLGFTALQKDGSILYWGKHVFWFADKDAKLEFQQIVSGSNVFVGLLKDKTVRVWGTSIAVVPLPADPKPEVKDDESFPWLTVQIVACVAGVALLVGVVWLRVRRNNRNADEAEAKTAIATAL